ncbi:hypothetical protein LTR37_019500 [Vermiconidia calcicola]|uniref:Uncharacterized protein n=1 Tax=Vermiconidia calcicola TaxID=1690605 RepID=A0ACC3MFW5_9PEZI|nr:hypothetical protein LTR37_019500 [Vermiconidia calcicola]
MTRSRAASAMGPTPAVSTSRAVLRRPTPTEGINQTTDMPEDTTHLRVTNPALAISNADNNAPAAAPMKNSMPTIRFIPHTETRSNRPSLHFTALTRTLSAHNSIVRVGRYSERDTHTHASPSSPASTSVTPVGFKSKVVSRRHCEFWCSNGQWFVKDVKSSSGTFLNHVRLSQPGSESRPYPVNDGDVVQLGIDFKGGEEVIFRCVKIRIECNRGWQKSLNSFNTSAHKRLLKHTGSLATGPKKARDSDATSTNSSECSICLNPVAPCQALFVAPCSHVWHYKFVADLEADVEPPEDLQEEVYEDEGDGDGGGQEESQDVSADQEDEGYDDEQGLEDVQDDNTVPTSLPPRNQSLQSASQRREGSRRYIENTSSESANSPFDPTLSLASLNVPTRNSNDEEAASFESQMQTRPIAINNSRREYRTTSSDADFIGARATTPTSTAPFALAAGMGMMNISTERREGEGDGEGEGPMTPTNDAGPFLLPGRDDEGGRVDEGSRGRGSGLATFRGSRDREREDGEGIE